MLVDCGLVPQDSGKLLRANEISSALHALQVRDPLKATHLGNIPLGKCDSLCLKRWHQASGEKRNKAQTGQFSLSQDVTFPGTEEKPGQFQTVLSSCRIVHPTHVFCSYSWEFISKKKWGQWWWCIVGVEFYWSKTTQKTVMHLLVIWHFDSSLPSGCVK